MLQWAGMDGIVAEVERGEGTVCVHNASGVGAWMRGMCVPLILLHYSQFFDW